MQLETVRIAAPDVPGGYIVINKSDLTPEHTLYEEPKWATGGTVPADFRVAINAEQVVTAERHAEVVNAAAPRIAQSSMSVAELKDALTAKGIAFPANAKRAQLLALLPN